MTYDPATPHKYGINLFIVFLTLSLFLSGLTAPALAYDWNHYKNTFLSRDGRIIDIYQSEISHSEGQGYGLLLALANNDKDSFYRVWHWTKTNLQIRKMDNLLCWSWGKRPNNKWEVIDFNNATDGDTLVAWALLKGYAKWHDQTLLIESKKIVIDIRKELQLSWKGDKFLLPGYYGFFNKGRPVLNPSYLIPSAFRDFAGIDDNSFWTQADISARKLFDKATFSGWSLPPDWLQWNEQNNRFTPSKEHRFSFDAWRVFLYLAWDGSNALQNAIDSLSAHFLKCGSLPQWIDLKTQSISLKECSAGIYAMVVKYAIKYGQSQAGEKMIKKAEKKIIHEQKDYYSASLYLLSRVSF